MQLTSAGLQDRADRLGGCWRVGPNIRVGCEHLAGEDQGARPPGRGPGLQRGAGRQVREVGPRARACLALTARSGTPCQAEGPVARGRAAHLPAVDPTRCPAPTSRRSSRSSMIASTPGASHKQIAENGIYDPDTRKAARQVARGLGVAAADYERGITPELRSLIRTPSRRTPQQRRRARQQRAWLRTLRRHHAKRAAPRWRAAAAGTRRGTQAGRRDGDRRQQPRQDGAGDHQGQRRPGAGAVVRRLRRLVLSQGRLQERHARMGGGPAVPAADRPQGHEDSRSRATSSATRSITSGCSCAGATPAAPRSRRPGRPTSGPSRATPDARARSRTRRPAATAST